VVIVAPYLNIAKMDASMVLRFAIEDFSVAVNRLPDWTLLVLEINLAPVLIAVGV
jgi:hypothetical protein